MLTIRLSRIGKNKKPLYRLIISEKTKDPYGDALEILGSYNPFKKDLVLKEDRVKYWLGQGVQMSPTVNNLLITKGIIQGEKVKASKTGKKKGEQAAAKPEAKTEAPVEPAEANAETKEEVAAAE